MRIERLDLVRYGKFTEHTLDFGTRAASDETPDFHIVFGPNEAGKSTLFNAWLDLLFGIETRSAYNFLHPYPTMRIGARLALGDGPQELARIKKQSQSLLDDGGLALPEGLLQGALGGVDRDAYRTMFSLDDETLEAGGNAILASEGDLGQMLFSASSGLATFSQGLKSLRDEAGEIHRKSGRNTDLRNLRKALDELGEKRRALDTAASAYRRLCEERDASEDAYKQALSESSGLTARLAEIETWLAALPRLVRLREQRDELQPLEALPDAPAGWAEDLPVLIKNDVRLMERKEATARSLAELAASIEAIEIDAAALEHAARIDALSERAIRARAATRDLPDEQLKLREIEGDITRILRELDQAGETDPARLLVPATRAEHLRKLMETRSGIASRVEAAGQELEAAEDAAKSARETLEAAGGDARPGDGLDAVNAALSALRGSDHATRLRHGERRGATLRAQLDERLANLAPWNGDSEALMRLRLPDPADIADWKATGHRLAEDRRIIEQQRDDLSRKHARLEGERAALERSADLFDEAEVARTRKARDEAWQDHRTRLDAESAERFLQALEADDRLTVARLAQSENRARHIALTTEIAGLSREIAETARQWEGIGEKEAALQARIAAALSNADPALGALSLASLETWAANRSAALEIRSQLQEAEAERRQAAEDGKILRENLAAALAKAGAAASPDAPLESLIDLAESLIDTQARLSRLRADLETHTTQAERRRKALQAAQTEKADWTTEWRETCAQCWFGQDEAPAPEIVRVLLDQLARLAPALEAHEDQMRRLKAIEAARTGFEREAKALAGELDLAAATDPLEVARLLSERVDTARRARDKRIELEDRHAEALANERALAAELESLTLRKEEMTSHFGVEDLEAVRKALEGLSRRAALIREAVEQEREILSGLSLADINEAESLLDAADPAALGLERAEKRQMSESAQARTRELYAAWTKAQDALKSVGGDDAVARLEEERQTLLLQIEEKARTWLRLQAGILAAEQALRAYRERHRSSMMERASRSFAEISNGAYGGLTTQADGDKEVLIGLDHAGRSKLATEMSKGTQFQLYLALRIAGYHEFVATRQSLPFVADDILETFDDERALETIRLLSDMARSGQVIYLTHHRHLCEIAKEVCPNATFHELPGPLAG